MYVLGVVTVLLWVQSRPRKVAVFQHQEPCVVWTGECLSNCICCSGSLY